MDALDKIIEQRAVEDGENYQKGEQPKKEDLLALRQENDNRKFHKKKPPPPEKMTYDEKSVSDDSNLSRSHRFYKSCFLEMYRNLSVLDLSEETIKCMFGIDGRTPYRAATEKSKDFDKKMQQSMAELEAKLARMMLVQAIGYSYQDEKITYYKDKENNKWQPHKKEISTKHQCGNPQLFIMYMTNRFPDLWKVSRELVTHKGESYDNSPSQRDRKKIVALARDILEADTLADDGKCLISP